MYKNFYGLAQQPFDISPDPRFYYPTERHNEGLASLSYGIGQRKGFIVLTGEVGTGKTLLVRYLLETLTRSNVQYAYVFNPRLSPEDFLRYVMAEFQLTPVSQNRGELLQQFSRYLIEVYRRGSTATLVIDEAHLLTHELLEEIRLLTNLETSSHKLLQIVLVGQPELDHLLDSPDLRQLKQRIALRCRLMPLSEADANGYIARRLRIAGAPKELMSQVFPPSTVRRILSYSGGIPRVINSICDNAMLNGYGRRERVITTEHIEEVASDLRLRVVEGAQPETAGLQPQAEASAPEPVAAAILGAPDVPNPSVRSEEPMSRVFDALRQYEAEGQQTASVPPPQQLPTSLMPERRQVPAETAPSTEATQPGLETVESLSVDLAQTNRLVAMSDEPGLGAEKFRVLATRLAHVANTMPLKTIEVTSSVVGEGKTLVAANLAITLAKRSGKKVLLIEGDLRKPAVCSAFGLAPQPGIGEWWQRQERRSRPRPESTTRAWHPAALLPFLRHFENSNLWLLAAGSVSHPMPILQSPRLADLMAQMVKWFDWVVVDTPPLLPMADSNLWAKLVDGTLLVVREGVVPRKALQRAIESLDNPKLVGVVMNDAANFDRVGYYGHYYGTEARKGHEGREDPRP